MNKIRTLNGIRRKYGTKRTIRYLFNYWCSRIHIGGTWEDAVWICERYIKNYDEKAICDHLRLMEANGAIV